MTHRRIPVLASIAVLLLLVVGGAWLWNSGGDDPGDVLRRRAANTAAPAVAESAQATGESSPEAQRIAEPVAPAAEPAAERAAPESYTRELAGLRGRVVEQDGTPVARLKVELLRIHPDLFLQSLQGGFVEPPPELVRPEVTTGETGEDGRFVLVHAEVGTLALLGIDLGGPRGTARLLDVALERGQSCDLGDIVLPAHVTFTGLVVDEDETPIAGARVRVIPQLPVPIPAQVIEVGVQDLRSDCAALIQHDKLTATVELPGWLRAGLDRLPLPTTRSGGDGRFELPGVPTGLVTLLIDRPGFVGIVRAGMPTGRNAEHDVGTQRLSSGRTVTGRVMAGEAPVAGARVFVGATVPFPFDSETLVALGQPVARATDADGRFTLAGLPESGDLLCAVQQDRGEPWRLLGPFDRDDVTLALPAAATLTVTIHDPAAAPVANAALRFVEDNDLNEVPILRGPLDLTRRTEMAEPGRYVVRGLPIGKWKVLASAPGLGVGNAAVELPAEGAAVTIALPPARSLAVHVVQAADRSPVDHALVAALIDQRGFIPMPFAVARSGPDGGATLEQLPAATALLLRVTHPGFAPAALQVAPDAAPPFEVALLRGGDLAGVVTNGGSPPGKPVMLVLQRHGERRGDLPEDEFPRFGVSLPDGNYRIRHLPAGEWRWMVYPRFFFVDPSELMKSAMDEPDELAKGECTIEEGKETRLDIEALPDGEHVVGLVRGSVHVSGQVEAGLSVRLTGRRHYDTKTDESGRFEFAEVRPGPHVLEVWREGSGGESQLHREPFVLASAATKEFHVDVRLAEVTITVTTRDGKPVAHVELTLTSLETAAKEDMASTGPMYASGSTDPTGRVTLPLQDGKWRVNASHDEHGRTRTEIEVAGHRDQAVALELDPGVTLRGRLEFEGVPPEGPTWQLALGAIQSKDDDDTEFTSWTEVSREEQRFEVKTVLPGRYRALLFTGDGMLRSEPFEVGPDGANDLALFMKPTG